MECAGPNPVQGSSVFSSSIIHCSALDVGFAYFFLSHNYIPLSLRQCKIY